MKENRKKVLEVRDLRQHFHVGVGKNKLTVKAVDGISFDIYEGEVFGLVGESGCGKTTTGRTIIKLYRPTDGTVKFNGKTIGAGYSGNLRRSEEHTSELQSRPHLVCRLLLEKKKNKRK